MKDIINDKDNSSFVKFIDQICLLNKCQVTTIVNIIALIISNDRTAEEINIIKDFMSAISSNLSLIARREGICANRQNTEELDKIKKSINKLENHNNDK